MSQTNENIITALNQSGGMILEFLNVTEACKVSRVNRSMRKWYGETFKRIVFGGTHIVIVPNFVGYIGDHTSLIKNINKMFVIQYSFDGFMIYNNILTRKPFDLKMNVGDPEILISTVNRIKKMLGFIQFKRSQLQAIMN